MMVLCYSPCPKDLDLYYETNRKSWLENWKKRPGADLPNDVSFDVNTYLQYSTKGTSGHKDIAHNKQSDMLPGKRFAIQVFETFKTLQP